MFVKITRGHIVEVTEYTGYQVIQATDRIFIDSLQNIYYYCPSSDVRYDSSSGKVTSIGSEYFYYDTRWDGDKDQIMQIGNAYFRYDTRWDGDKYRIMQIGDVYFRYDTRWDGDKNKIIQIGDKWIN